MNDDASLGYSELHQQHAEPTASASETLLPAEAQATSRQDDEEKERRSRARTRSEKRAALLDDLVRNLDIMIYCELSILYYMDNSLLRFLIRAIPEWFYFTPKPPIFTPPNATTMHRPYVTVIFLTNSLILLLHLLSSAPSAGEAMRGYLHGGLLIDFVGQQGPISKVKLVLLDIMTLVFQLCILSVTVERKALKVEIEGGGTGTRLTTETTTTFGQDHDSEERGVLRSSNTNTSAGVSGIELQELLPNREDDAREREELVNHPSSRGDSNEDSRSDHPLNAFSTGEYVIVNLHIMDTIRTQWSRSGTIETDTSAASASASSNSSSAAAMAAVIAQRRIALGNFRFNVAGRGSAWPA